MRNSIKFIFLLYFVFASCSSISEKKFNDNLFTSLAKLNVDYNEKNQLKILDYYRNYEIENRFSFEDLNLYLEDVDYERKCSLLGREMSIQGKKTGDLGKIYSYFKGDSLIVKFDFFANCCSRNLADFKLKKNILTIKINNISTSTCDCNCGYEYIYSIFDKSQKIKIDSIITRNFFIDEIL